MTKGKSIQLAKDREIREAQKKDIPVIMELIKQGKKKMLESGNKNQWTSEHPNEADIENDIKHKGSFLLLEENVPIATFAFLPSPEPTYSYIEGGEWLDDKPYYVIHRVASAEGVHGAMRDIISYCMTRTESIRIDTHADNKPMQAALRKLGFVYCGVIYLQNGDSRVAFQLTRK